MDQTRRQLLTGISIVGAGALLVGCRNPGNSGGATNKENKNEQADEAAAEISAPEDLMREHGILRRVLLVYRESAMKLRQDSNSVPLDVLEKAAQLFRAFGQDYHEKQLEEAFVFPSIKKAANATSVYADVLTAQHARGREITDFLLAVSAADKIPATKVEPFIAALESFARMYEHHAAVEDTIIFPAWKEAIGSQALDEAGAKFEEIEEEMFGEDGFDAALRRIAEIEESLGLANLGMFTAPPPAK